MIRALALAALVATGLAGCGSGSSDQPRFGPCSDVVALGKTVPTESTECIDVDGGTVSLAGTHCRTGTDMVTAALGGILYFGRRGQPWQGTPEAVEGTSPVLSDAVRSCAG